MNVVQTNQPVTHSYPSSCYVSDLVNTDFMTTSPYSEILPDSPPHLPPPILPPNQHLFSNPPTIAPPPSSGYSPVSSYSSTFPLTPLNINNDYTSSFLVSTRALSCSRGNFAANLNRAWFSTDERKSSNVRGKNNKRKLSPNRVQRIYNAVFHMFPITQRENEQDSWKECVRAIDVANRQLKRQKGKEN